MSGTKYSAGNARLTQNAGSQRIGGVREPLRPRKSRTNDPGSDPPLYFFRSKRLGFRTWSEQNLSLAIGLWGDPQVTKFIDVRQRLSDEDVKQLLENQIETQRENGIQYWPVFLLESGEHVGCCGLRPHDPANSIYEFGVHIRSM